MVQKQFNPNTKLKLFACRSTSSPSPSNIHFPCQQGLGGLTGARKSSDCSKFNCPGISGKNHRPPLLGFRNRQGSQNLLPQINPQGLDCFYSFVHIMDILSISCSTMYDAGQSVITQSVYQLDKHKNRTLSFTNNAYIQITTVSLDTTVIRGFKSFFFLLQLVFFPLNLRFPYGVCAYLYGQPTEKLTKALHSCTFFQSFYFHNCYSDFAQFPSRDDQSCLSFLSPHRLAFYNVLLILFFEIL